MFARGISVNVCVVALALCLLPSFGCGLIETGIAYAVYKHEQDKERDWPYRNHEVRQDEINDRLSRADPTRREQWWENDSDGGIYTAASKQARKDYKRAKNDADRAKALETIRNNDIPSVKEDMMALQAEIEGRTRSTNSLGRATPEMVAELQGLQKEYLELEQILFTLQNATPAVVGPEFHVWNDRFSVLAVFGYTPAQFPPLTAQVIGVPPPSAVADE